MKKIIGILLLCAVQFSGVGAAYGIPLVLETKSTPSGRIASAKPPINSTLSFQKFNSTLVDGHIGILNSVTISVKGNVLSDVTMQNTASVASYLSATIGGNMLLNLNGETVVDIFNPLWRYSRIPVAGNTSVDLNNVTNSLSGQAVLDSASYLSLFTGTGNIDFLATTIFETGTTTSGGSTDFITTVRAWAWEDVTITYDYTDSGSPPVPEPGTILLLGSGVLAFGAAQFRRHSPRLRRRRTKL